MSLCDNAHEDAVLANTAEVSDLEMNGEDRAVLKGEKEIRQRSRVILVNRLYLMQPNKVVGLSNDARAACLDVSAHKGVVVLRKGRGDQDVDILATKPAKESVNNRQMIKA